jgi:Flp pilus assembly protein CpaB
MKPAKLALALAAGLAGTIAGYFALVAQAPTAQAPTAQGPTDKVTGDASVTRAIWAEVKWPFPIDQWGTGRAFACSAADCGAEAELYLRAKLGSCNCTTGVADDADLDRMSDFDLLGAEVAPLSTGRPVTIAWMKGRSRAYTLAARNRPGKSAISVAFSDRCDMIVATVVLPHDRLTTIEPAVMEFLNSRNVLHWAEVALGI